MNFGQRRWDLGTQTSEYGIKLNEVNVLNEKQGRVSEEMM